MSNKLGFMIWGEGEPVYVAKGQTNQFTDGDTISLIHETEGFDFEKDTFCLEMSVDGHESVSHEFKMEKFRGNNIWLVVDPSLTDKNGSFTDKFVNVLSALPAGELKIDMKFLANGTLKNEGYLTYNSTGQHEKFKVIAEKLQNIDAVRASAIDEHQQEMDNERAEREAADKAKNYFTLTVKSRNAYESTYLLETNKQTLSENIHLIEPEDSLQLELFRGGQYDLSVFGQYDSKESARPLSYVDESMHESTLVI